MNYLLNEQPDKALEVFIDLVDVDTETVETHLVLGNMFRRRGEVDRAIRIHQNLIARPALEAIDKSTALLELAKDYLKAGLLDRAESLLNDVIDIGMQTDEAYPLLLGLYEQENTILLCPNKDDFIVNVLKSHSITCRPAVIN